MMRTKIVPKLTVRSSTKRIAKGWSDLLQYLLLFSCLNPCANHYLNLTLSERELGTRIPKHTKTFELLYLYQMLWDKRLYKKSTETCFYVAGRRFLFSSFSAAAAGLERIEKFARFWWGCKTSNAHLSAFFQKRTIMTTTEAWRAGRVDNHTQLLSIMVSFRC